METEFESIESYIFWLQSEGYQYLSIKTRYEGEKVCVIAQQKENPPRKVSSTKLWGITQQLLPSDVSEMTGKFALLLDGLNKVTPLHEILPKIDTFEMSAFYTIWKDHRKFFPQIASYSRGWGKISEAGLNFLRETIREGEVSLSRKEQHEAEEAYQFLEMALSAWSNKTFYPNLMLQAVLDGDVRFLKIFLNHYDQKIPNIFAIALDSIELLDTQVFDKIEDKETFLLQITFEPRLLLRFIDKYTVIPESVVMFALTTQNRKLLEKIEERKYSLTFGTRQLMEVAKS